MTKGFFMLMLYMTSCLDRTRQQLDTIKQFDKFNYTWRTVDYKALDSVGTNTALVVTQTCPKPLIAGNHKRSGVATMQHAFKHGCDWLHVEDDIILADDFNIFLDMAIAQRNRVTYFYFNDFLPRVYDHYPKSIYERIKSKKPMKRVLMPCVTSEELYGCQAVFIPHEILGLFLLDDRVIPENEPLPFDTMLSNLTRDLTKGALVALPHPVQHRADLTQFSEKVLARKRSHSFDVPRQE